MKKFLKTSIVLISLCVIVILSIFIVFYTKEGIQNVVSINEYLKKIEKEKKEFNNEDILQTAQKQDKILKVEPQIIIEKPAKGVQFGTLKIPSIDVELAMMNGTTKSLLSQGVGIDEESYLPGEGGSIVLMGHNFKQFLARLPDTKNGDEVILITNYGEFHYTIYDSKIVKESDIDEVPIQKDEEIVMVYTCWPIPNVTHANDRYVIYAK